MQRFRAGGHGGTVGAAVKGGRSGAPMGSQAEGIPGSRRAVTSPLGQMTTIGRLRGDSEAVRLLGNSSFWPVESVCRDGQGLVKLTVLGRYGRLTYLLRADEPCRVIHA